MLGILAKLLCHVEAGLQEAAAARFDELVNPRREKEALGKVG